MGKEGLEEGAVHVRVALVWRHITNDWRHITNDWRVISRHDRLIAQLVWIEERNARVRLEHEVATGTAGKLTRGKHDDARARDDMNPSPARTCSSAPGRFRYIVRASLLRASGTKAIVLSSSVLMISLIAYCNISSVSSGLAYTFAAHCRPYFSEWDQKKPFLSTATSCASLLSQK
jgi:hypothetical protein